MFGFCIESSHSRGLGHLYRSLNFIKYLTSINEKSVVFINDDKKAIEILKSQSIVFETVDLNDYESNWEEKLIKKYALKTWVNDRLDTKLEHSQNVKDTGIKLITFDDKGKGASLADINCSTLTFDNKEKLKGKRF